MLTIKRTGDESYERYIKALICGDPGSGKTLISSTFPDPFYLTTEGLMMSVAERNIPFHKLETVAELEFAIKMLQQKPSVRAKQFGFPVQTLVVDTIDDVARLVLRERMKAEKHETAQMSDYGYLKGQMEGITTALRNLEMNVVLTSHLKTKEVDNVFLGIVPAIPGSFADDIAGYVDLALVLQSEVQSGVDPQTKTMKRTLVRYVQCEPDSKHKFIKDHSGKLPQRFPLNFQDDYARLLATAYPHRPTEVAAAEEAEVEAESVAGIETVSADTAPTPDPIPVPDGELPLNVPEEIVEPRFTCQKCDLKFDDEEQRDRSKIKHRRVFCAECFALA